MNPSFQSAKATSFIQEEVSLAFLTNQAIAKLAAFRAELTMRNLKDAQRLLDEHVQLVNQIKQLKAIIASQNKFESELLNSSPIGSQS